MNGETEKPLKSSLEERLGEGGREFMARAIAIVILLKEKGLLLELLQSGKLSAEEIDAKARFIESAFEEYREWADDAPSG